MLEHLLMLHVDIAVFNFWVYLLPLSMDKVVRKDFLLDELYLYRNFYVLFRNI